MTGIWAAVVEPSVTRALVVSTARSLIGVKYRHQGRNRHGLDCIGVPGYVGLLLNFQSAKEWLADDSCKGYGSEPDEAMLLAACNRYLVRVDVPQIGDIHLMAWEGRARHFGIITQFNPAQIVHAYAAQAARKVCETGVHGEYLDGITWASLIHSTWRYRELS